MKNLHDKYAPYWAVAMVVLGGCGLSTVWIFWGSFVNGYLLDMTGPAWNYILFRGLYTAKADNWWTRFFTPIRTYIIFICVSFGIEFIQYLKLYDATYDPWDFLAYLSVLTPLFIIDSQQQKKEK